MAEKLAGFAGGHRRGVAIFISMWFFVRIADGRNILIYPWHGCALISGIMSSMMMSSRLDRTFGKAHRPSLVDFSLIEESEATPAVLLLAELVRNVMSQTRSEMFLDDIGHRFLEN